jgi:hypothetical protein
MPSTMASQSSSTLLHASATGPTPPVHDSVPATHAVVPGAHAPVVDAARRRREVLVDHRVAVLVDVVADVAVRRRRRTPARSRCS